MLSTNSEILYIIITYNIESECPQQFAEVSLHQSGLLYLLTCQLTLFQIHPRMQVLLYRYICVHVCVMIRTASDTHVRPQFTFPCNTRIKNPYQRFLKFRGGTEIIKKQQKASKVIEIGGFCCFYTSC